MANAGRRGGEGGGGSLCGNFRDGFSLLGIGGPALGVRECTFACMNEVCEIIVFFFFSFIDDCSE